MSTQLLSEVKTCGVVKSSARILNPTEDGARKVDELLSDNHRKNHIFFIPEHEFGVNLHNHLTHHALTLLAIGASADQIQRHHERNQSYQRRLPHTKQVIIDNLDDPTVFKASLGKDEAYLSFLSFFDQKIALLGLKDFLSQYVFGESDQAREVFNRLFHGYLHPLISFGFGIEFQQLAIVSEGVAQASCHNDLYYTPVFLAINELSKSGAVEPSSLIHCIEAARNNPDIRNSCDISYFRQFEPDARKPFVSRDQTRDGVIPRGGDSLINIAARWQVREDEVPLKAAELANTAAYLVGCSQRPPYESRFDFFLLHGLTTSIHCTAMVKEEAIQPKDLARILEYLGRTIILLYAGIGCPEQNLVYALAHTPKTMNRNWDDIFKLAAAHEDDGHMAKFIRALANAQDVSLPYDERPEFRLKQSMFLALAQAAIDSKSSHPMFQGHPLDWIRGAGWEEAWESVPRREDRAKLGATH